MINIESEIYKKFPNLRKKPELLKKSLIKTAQKLIHENQVNNFLKENNHLKGLDFVEAIMDYFHFDFTYSSNEINNIPSTGRVVIIANHPLGALDAMALLKLVGSIRKDVKIVANDFLQGIKNLESLFIAVDSFKSAQAKQSIENIYKALEEEQAVIIFPAGEVSRVSMTGIKDKIWKKGFLNFAKKTKAPILPILIDAKNSKTFYTLSILNKTFSTILLSDEMFKKQDKTISMYIGNLISNEDIKPVGYTQSQLMNLYKKHLYALKKKKKSYFKTTSGIAHEVNRKNIIHELKNSELLGKTNDGKKIYLYSVIDDSYVLKEIGRLRELSFRKVNEGVNKKRDIDVYDSYYKHIVLWDEDELEIVGSYRIGICDDIYDEYGFDGLYTNTLFKMNKSFEKYMQYSIELGRSFVQPKYWGSRALEYLWYGIGAFLKKNTHIKYMYGPVSLSASFPTYAKELMVDFYMNYFRTEKKLITAINPFEFETSQIALDNPFKFDDYKNDFKELKNQLKSMDQSVPTLYKQYTELCEDGGIEFHGFNVDPQFSNCIDGFILVEIDKIKETKRKRYMGE
jgi:putative hemolysin